MRQAEERLNSELQEAIFKKGRERRFGDETRAKNLQNRFGKKSQEDLVASLEPKDDCKIDMDELLTREELYSEKGIIEEDEGEQEEEEYTKYTRGQKEPEKFSMTESSELGNPKAAPSRVEKQLVEDNGCVMPGTIVSRDLEEIHTGCYHSKLNGKIIST